MPDAIIGFRVDDAYLEEFHDAWVATAGRGWRLGRRLTLALALVGAVLLAASAASVSPAVPAAGVGCFVLAAVNVAVRRRAKARWIAIAREKLPVGAVLRLVVEGGRVRREGPGGEEGAGATAALADAPRGWLVRLTMPAAPGSGAEPQATTLYVPHRSIQPPMDRAAFRALLDRGSPSDGAGA